MGINPRLIDPPGARDFKIGLEVTQRPSDDWPDALDHLTIGLVANKCRKLAKISEILLLSLGLSYMKITLCSVAQYSCPLSMGKNLI